MLPRSKSSKLFLFFIFLFLSTTLLMLIEVSGATIYNPSRTPSLEGNVHNAYPSDYEVDFLPTPDYPLRSTEWVRLYYRINSGEWSYEAMSLKSGITYEKQDYTPASMGASDGDTIQYYFKGMDDEGDSDQSSTYTFVSVDFGNPIISSLSPSGSSGDGDITISATITDSEMDVDSADFYVYNVDQDTWTKGSMSEGASNSWSGSYLDANHDLGDKANYTVAGIDDHENNGFDNEYATDSLSDSWNFNEDLDDWVLGRGSVFERAQRGNNMVGKLVSQGTQQQYSYFWVYVDDISIDTSTYCMVLVNYHVDTAYDWKWFGIYDGSQYIAKHDNADCKIYNNVGVCSTDDYNTVAFFIDPDLTGTETYLRLYFTPYDYPNQDTAVGDQVLINWIAFVNPTDFTVTDSTHPSMSNPSHSPVNPDDDDDITLEVDVTDETGISKVICYWKINSGSWNNHVMTLDSGSTYNYTISDNWDVDDTIYYYFWSNDTLNNYGTLGSEGSPYSQIIGDNTNPVLSEPSHIPTNPTEENTITFQVTATDNGELDKVYVHYKINSGSWTNYIMAKQGVTDIFRITIGTQDIGTIIKYYYWANDTYSNEVTLNNGGSNYTITVTDQTNPVVSNVQRDIENPIEDQQITITATVTDNNDLDKILVYVKINSGSWTSYEMTNTEGSTYSKNIGSFEFGETIYYYVWANDTYSNSHQSSTSSVELIDTTPPVIVSITHSPTEARFDTDSLTFTVAITDNEDLNQLTVKIYYKLDTRDSYSSVSMNLVESTFNYTFCSSDFDQIGKYDYYVTAADLYNTTTSDSDTFSIVQPGLPEPTEPTEPDWNRTHHFDVTTIDNFYKISGSALALGIVGAVIFLIQRKEKKKKNV